MKPVKRAVVVAVIAAGVIGAAPAVSAVATTEYPDGGTWVYDANGSTNYSNYYHASKKHRSSVQNCNGLVRSTDAVGGLWSYASEGVCLSGNQAFYYVY